MNKLHSLYSCKDPNCTSYPMLVVTTNIKDDSTSFRKLYTDRLGGTSVMVPKETGGEALSKMLNINYSGPTFWIEPSRHYTNIIAGGGFHKKMTDSLIALHNLKPHKHETAINKCFLEESITFDITVKSDMLFIRNYNKPKKIKVLNLQGKEMFSVLVFGEKKINISHIPSGMYLTKVIGINGVHTSKFIKM